MRRLQQCRVSWGLFPEEESCNRPGTWVIGFHLPCRCLGDVERFYCDAHKAAMLNGTLFLCPVCAEMKTPDVSSVAAVLSLAAT